MLGKNVEKNRWNFTNLKKVQTKNCVFSRSKEMHNLRYRYWSTKYDNTEKGIMMMSVSSFFLMMNEKMMWR